MPIVKSDWWIWVAPIGNQIAIATLPVVATVVLPNVRVSGNQLVTGNLTAGGIITGQVSSPDTPVTISGNTDGPGIVTDVILAQNAEVTGALKVDGAITAVGGVAGALAVTGALSGASVATAEADIRHGTVTIHKGPSGGVKAAGAPAYTGGATAISGWQSTAAADAIDFDLDFLKVGDRVLSAFMYGTAAVGVQWSGTLSTLNLVTGANAVLGTINSGINAARAFKQVFSGSFTVPNTNTVLVMQWVSIGGAGQQVFGVEVNYDRP